MQEIKVILKICGVISAVLTVIVGLLAVLLVGIKLTGFEVYTVLSGSMEPTYCTGSVIYVQRTDYQSLRVGDPITFIISEDTVATHRIVEVIPDDEELGTIRFKTKGDANETVDGNLVHHKNVLGKPVFTIPYLGYLAHYIQSPPGVYIAISVSLLLTLMAFIPELMLKGKKVKKRIRIY